MTDLFKYLNFELRPLIGAKSVEYNQTYKVFTMSGHQVIANHGDREWDSIRDTDRQALHKVADYMKKDYDSNVVAVGHMIQDKLIFGHNVTAIIEQSRLAGVEILVKYIP